MVESGACYKTLLGNSGSYESEGAVCQEAMPAWTFGSYKPRGSLARALYEKQQADEYLNNLDKAQWYRCDLKKFSDSLASRFVQLEPDEETVRFLQRSEDKSDWILTQIWHSLAKAFLGWFMTQTSINGWLRRGSMFVVSLNQFLKLLGVGTEWRGENLLDLGAGDGEVTAHMSSIFKNTYVTEMSGTMRALLSKRGYTVLDVDRWHEEKQYDVISCLNLLDRCNKPYDVLHQMKVSLKPDGRIVLAIVLPFSPYVEFGTNDYKPSQLLPIRGSTFEEQVKSIVDDVLTPSGFDVVSWSRIPYLCEGDLRQSYYWLDDVIFVLKLADSRM